MEHGRASESSSELETVFDKYVLSSSSQDVVAVVKEAMERGGPHLPRVSREVLEKTKEGRRVSDIASNQCRYEDEEGLVGALVANDIRGVGDGRRR